MTVGGDDEISILDIDFDTVSVKVGQVCLDEEISVLLVNVGGRHRSAVDETKRVIAEEFALE